MNIYGTKKGDLKMISEKLFKIIIKLTTFKMEDAYVAHRKKVKTDIIRKYKH